MKYTNTVKEARKIGRKKGVISSNFSLQQSRFYLVWQLLMLVNTIKANFCSRELDLRDLRVDFVITKLRSFLFIGRRTLQSFQLKLKTSCRVLVTISCVIMTTVYKCTYCFSCYSVEADLCASTSPELYQQNEASRFHHCILYLECGFLYSFAILGSIPNKLGGVIAFVLSINILIIVPFT